MPEAISVSKDIAAPPAAVFALVSDLARMGEWSPENTGGSWRGGATGPALGARFRGTNRQGKKHWATSVLVSRFEPDREFAFDVSAVGFKVARWGYSVEPTESGCRVTESWTDARGALVRVAGKVVSGVDHDEAHTRDQMARTLAALATAAEALPAS